MVSPSFIATRYIGRMRTLPIAVLAALLLSGCSTDHATSPPDRGPPAPPPNNSPPPPPERKNIPTSAVPVLRTDGDLLARHQRIVDEAKKGGHEIAFLGDSITEGWAGAGKAEWDKTWAPRHTVNCGIGGDRTQHVLGRLDHGLMEALSAPNNSIRWVVLMIGTNNAGAVPPDSAEDIASGIQAIVASLRQGLPQARVLLIDIFPRGEWPNPMRDTINATNARIAGLIDGKQVVGMDLGPKFLKPDGELPGAIMPDYLHLSPAGYAIWSEALAIALNP
jgi:N-acetylglucosamine-6-sulfatase